MEIDTFRAMNTNIQLGAEGTDPQSIRAGFKAVQQYIQEKEKQFTRFSAASELSKLNQVRGAWFHVSADMLEVISLARDYAEETNGLFDPSILPDLQRAGYDRSMDLIREHGALPGGWNTKSGKTVFDEILIRPEEHQVSLPVEMSLDLGGIAKGWIAEKAAALLANYAPVCIVNAGGDLFTIGTPEKNGCWEVDIENPFAPEETAVILRLPETGLATSAVTRRTWKLGQQQMHHLIDPRTGRPAHTEWASVTVIAPHTHTCEVYAKALLIGGPAAAEELLRGKDLAFIAIDHQNNMIGNEKSTEYINAG